MEGHGLSRDKAMNGVKAIFERYHLIADSQGFNGFDMTVMRSLKLIDASYTPGAAPLATCTFELEIDEYYTNLNNVMHGGAAGVIFDMCTTSALGPIATPGYWDFMGGVTRTLNLSYLRAVPIGTKVHIHSELVQAGRTTAMIRGEMRSAGDDGRRVVYCTAEHHKVSVPTLKAHLGREFQIEWDREMAAAREGEEGRKKAKL